ncbi:MAG: phosphoribosyltransferase [Epsilonproteobacteria bacterium]|nr:MAG: phosphoribosyltransferase [Campylobacterota bacterium]
MNYYGYDECRIDVRSLIEQSRAYEPEAIVAIARGGLMLGELIGYGLNIRNVQSIHVESYDDDVQRERVKIFGSCDLNGLKQVLIVDDIVDSGKTMQAVIQHFKALYPECDFKIAAIFYKPSAILQPDFSVKEATGWIDFFWDVDFA